MEASAGRLGVDHEREHSRELMRKRRRCLRVPTDRRVFLSAGRRGGTEELCRRSARHVLVSAKRSDDGPRVSPEDGGLVKDAATIRGAVGEHTVVDAAAGRTEPAIFAR